MDEPPTLESAPWPWGISHGQERGNAPSVALGITPAQDADPGPGSCRPRKSGQVTPQTPSPPPCWLCSDLEAALAFPNHPTPHPRGSPFFPVWRVRCRASGSPLPGPSVAALCTASTPPSLAEGSQLKGPPPDSLKPLGSWRPGHPAPSLAPSLSALSPCLWVPRPCPLPGSPAHPAPPTSSSPWGLLLSLFS